MYCQEFWILDYTWLTCEGRRWKSLMDLDRLGGWGEKKEHVVTEKTCQLSWRQIKNKCTNAIPPPLARTRARCQPPRRWGIWFHAAVTHFRLRVQQERENRPRWSRSVSSLVPADVCRVLVGKRVRRRPKHPSWRCLTPPLTSRMYSSSSQEEGGKKIYSLLRLIWLCFYFSEKEIS